MELLANYLSGEQGKIGEIKGAFKSAMVLGWLTLLLQSLFWEMKGILPHSKYSYFSQGLPQEKALAKSLSLGSIRRKASAMLIQMCERHFLGGGSNPCIVVL